MLLGCLILLAGKGGCVVLVVRGGGTWLQVVVPLMRVCGWRCHTDNARDA